MNKKIALIVFTILCTVGITFSIASFSLGINGSSSGSDSNNLDDVYNSYYTQIQHIIDMSNETTSGSDGVYHIVQIVDDKTNANVSYLATYAADGASGVFPKEVLDAYSDNYGKTMAPGKIEVLTRGGKDADLPAAIRNADLVYLACNVGYTAGNDLSSDAYNALQTYASTDCKPIIIDREVIGLSSESVQVNTEDPSVLADHLLDISQKVDSSTVPIVYDGTDWEQFMTEMDSNGDTTVDAIYNQYFDDNHIYRFLEVVPDENTKKEFETTNTSFHNAIINGAFNNEGAFIDPSKVDFDTMSNVEYKLVTVKELETDLVQNAANKMEAFKDYDFIYFNHEKAEKQLDKNTNDISSDADQALEWYFTNSTVSTIEPSSDDKKESIHKIIIHTNYTNSVETHKSESDPKSTSTASSSGTNAYMIAQSLSTSNGLVQYNNAVLVGKGFFNSDDQHMNKVEDGYKPNAKLVADLINSSTYRDYFKTAYDDGSANFKVLEIEPYFSVTDTSWYSSNDIVQTNEITDSTGAKKTENLTARELLTKNLSKNSAEQEVKEDNNRNKNIDPYYYHQLTKARIAAATGLNPKQIDISYVTMNSLSSTAPELLEDYDLIYLGSDNRTVKDKKDWNVYNILTNTNGKAFFSFLPTDLEKYFNPPNGQDPRNTKIDGAYVYNMYSHTGDWGFTVDALNTQFNNYEGTHDRQNSYNATNGNDMTAKVYLKLYEYIKAGMPVIIDKKLMDSDYLIGGASVNADLATQASLAAKGYMDSSDVSTISSGSSSITLPRLVMDYTVSDGSVKGYKYKKTTFSENTMKARQESSIDPSSYMYQLLWSIAEDKNNDIYHKSNVFVGFDSSDIIENTYKNIYTKGATKNDAETITADSKDILVSGFNVDADKLKDKNVTLFNNNRSVNAITKKVNVAKSGAGVQLKYFLNEYAVPRSQLNMIVQPRDYKVITKNGVDNAAETKKYSNVNSRSPVYKYSIAGVEGTQYTVELYYDFDGDGKFSNNKTEGRLEDSDYESECVFRGSYTVGPKGSNEIKTIDKNVPTRTTKDGDGLSKDFIVDPDFVGILPWKLVCTDTAGKKIVKTGYPKYYAETEKNKQKLKLLQLIPGEEAGWFGTTINDVTTLCKNESHVGGNTPMAYNKKEEPIGFNDEDKGKHVFGLPDANDSKNNLADFLEEYDIDLQIMTFGMYSKYVNLYIENYAQNFATYSAEDIAAKRITQKEADIFKRFMSSEYMTHTEGSNDYKLTNAWLDITDFSKVSSINKIYDFGNMNNAKSDDEKIGVPDSIMATLLYYGSHDAELKLNTSEVIDYKFNTNGFDMIVIGFSKENGSHNPSAANDISNLGCCFLSSYIAQNGNVMFGTDTTSMFGYLPKSGTTSWSRTINTYLRGSFGMDRFKYEETGNDNYAMLQKSHDAEAIYESDLKNKAFGWRTFKHEPYATSDYNENGQTYPGEFQTMYSFDGTYETVDNDSSGKGLLAMFGATDSFLYGYTKKSDGDGGKMQTIFKGVEVESKAQTTDYLPSSQIALNNQGLITRYPFQIETTAGNFKISKTNSQYYALDTEDEDMQIWYSLAGAAEPDTNLYAADPMNGRSFYYMYSYKSVTYTGAGYSAITAEKDNNDERKLIINALLCKTKIHRSGPRVVFNKYSGSRDITSEFVPATGENSMAVLNMKSTDTEQCAYDFKVTSAASKKLSQVVMFIDKDGDGELDSGDLILKYYGKDPTKAGKDKPEFVSNDTVSICGADLPSAEKAYLDTAIQSGNFIITVAVTDSNGDKASARLNVKTKSTLFNLN